MNETTFAIEESDERWPDRDALALMPLPLT
jgi:hypothetical protein